MKRYLALLALAFPSLIFSQTSAYQSADGNSSIYLMNAKANLIWNVSSSTFNVGYLLEGANESLPPVPADSKANNPCDTRTSAEHDAKVADPDSPASAVAEHGVRLPCRNKAAPKGVGWLNLAGLSVTGKPLSDLSTQIFQSGNAPASIGGGGLIGRHGVISPREVQKLARGENTFWRDDWFLVDFAYKRSTFNVTPSTTSTTYTAQNFDSFSILPTYNVFGDIGSAFNFLGGVSTGIARANNLSSLTSVTISSTTFQNPTTTVSTKQVSAYAGQYETFLSVPLYSDFVFIPEKLPLLHVDLFTRAELTHANRYGEEGVGLFMAQPGTASQILGGVDLSWKNGKREIAMVAGWTF